MKVHENEYFPCDLLILNSSLPKGICFVETKSLDGETNLKHKQANKYCIQLAKHECDVLQNFNDGVIECEKPNASIYTFAGSLKIPNKDLNIPLDAEQMLLRGSSLRNTEWVYGIAVFTGHDTKVMMNSATGKAKRSRIEITTNRYILLCIVA